MPTGTVPLDDTEFAAFLQRAMPAVRTFLQRLTPFAADADDVLQETMAKVWRLRHSYDPSRNGDGWLKQAAFRAFCDHRRRLRTAPPATGDAGQHPAPARPCEIELRDEVRQQLRQLPQLERELLLGFHVAGLSLRELAARHALAVNTVKSHLHRARRRLQAGTGGGDR